jgi:hypothetical protein
MEIELIIPVAVILAMDSNRRWERTRRDPQGEQDRYRRTGQSSYIFRLSFCSSFASSQRDVDLDCTFVLWLADSIVLSRFRLTSSCSMLIVNDINLNSG